MKLTLKPFPRPALLAAITTAIGLQSAIAAIPAPEKLLPDDTLVVVTAPDFAKFRDIYKASPQTQLWNDPAMKPFKDHFLAKLQSELVQPLEKDLGVSLDDYTSLPQGQLTFAMTQNGWKTADAQQPGFLLLLDAKNHSSQLTTNLANLKRKWLDSGKSIKTEKLRDIEFSVLPLSEQDVPKSLKKIFKSDEEEEDSTGETNRTSKAELVFGQYESLLIVGNSTKAVEKIAIHLTGGSMPSLGDLAAFDANRTAMFRDVPGYGWVNLKLLIELMLKDSGKDAESNPMAAMFNAQKIISAMGVGSLRTLAFSFQSSADGTSAQFSLGVPESGRQGLFKLFPAPGKDSTPPAFVPADAVKFQRLRIDGQKVWPTIQAMLSEISPEASGSLDYIIGTANEAAKQKDPDFDLRKNLFGNLGDDIIAYEKAPTTAASLKDFNTGPSLFLIGSPQPEQLASALKVVFQLTNPQAGAPKEREFLGRKIYSMQAPSVPTGNASKGKATLSYAASGSYVAITTDSTILEEYLRSSDGEQKQLRETPGLTDAMAKVGGGNTGWFSFENQTETTRAILETLRKSASTEESTNMLADGIPAFTPENPFKEWVDFSLLPPFETISKYFSYAVYTGSADPDGINFRFFSPVPAGLKK
ncbi:MAG TPA: hypothetical protein VK327_10920 [Candidatus Paceibacterota bacterium]|nr:hypothetical protein [Candidatus Paceibacterota bacterium]